MKTKLLLLLTVLFSAFSMNAQVNTVALVGEAAGGWPGDPGNPGPTDLHQMTSTDGENWTLTAVTLTSANTGGGVKFRANNDWTINWGSAAFPNGTGTNNGANILCIAGTYDVTFNSTTGVYAFSGGAPIPVVKLVGTAVSDPAGISLSTTDLTNFSVSGAMLLAGDAQFEVDGVLYGGTTFPMGAALSNTDMIPVVAGTYTTISVNIGSGDYNFVAAPVYPSIAIVGAGAGGWPTGAPGEVDVNQMTTTDGIMYTLESITLTSDQIKFRENNMWTNSWGSTAWPSGIGALNGPDNIPAVAGTYKATFNRTTGEYTFTVPSIAIVGAGTDSGWPAGTPGEIDPHVMTTTDGVNYSVNAITFSDNPIKLRANNDWGTNWGGTSWPTGVLVPNSSDNIPAVAGVWNVTFNKLTLEFAATPNLATTSFTTSTFKVSPNPTNSNWNFTSVKEAIVSIQVVDMLGKVVATSNTTSVDASALANGVYFAKVSSETATQTIKVVKN